MSEPAPLPVVAVLGTGKMGGAMARRLHEQGVAVRLWNRDPERARRLECGEVHERAADAVADAGIALTMLTDPAAVREVFSQALRAGGSRVYVDMSTVDAGTHAGVARDVHAAGSRFVEAPVLGSIPMAATGRLTILAAGDRYAVEEATPILQLLGSVEYVGDLGSAATLKLVANAALAVVTAMGGELLNAAEAHGVDAERAWWVLTRLVPYLDFRRRGFMERTYEPPTFRVGDMLKDVELALETLAGSRMPLTEATRTLFDEAAGAHGESDVAAVNEVFRRGER